MSRTPLRDAEAPGHDLDDGVTSLVGRLVGLLPRRVRSLSTVTVVALALIALQLLLRTWATAGSWFMWDDYIFIADVTRGDADWGWLFHVHYSLIQPVGFLLVKAVGWAGFSWSAYAVQMLVLQLLASLACWWMLRVVFGNRPLILLPLLFYLFCPLTVPPSVWWSVAIYQYPHHIAIFGAIAMHVAYLRHGRRRHLAAATAFLVLGLGAYVKAPLIPVVLLGISALWFTQGALRQRVVQLLRAWPAWVAYGVVTALYVWFWASAQRGHEPPRNCELPGVFENSLLHTISTGVVGGPWQWRWWTGGIDPFIASSSCVPQSYRGDPDLVVGGAPQSLVNPGLTGVVLAVLLVVALAFLRWARHHHALRSLPIVAVYVVTSALLVHLGRAATFGSQVSAREIRYFSDLAAVGAFAIGTALLPIVGAAVVLRRRRDPLITWSMPRAGVVGLVVVFLVGSLVSTMGYVRPWHSRVDATAFPERVYVDRVQESLAQTGPVRVADVPLPTVVANPVIHPYNLPSRKLAALAPRLTAVEQGTDLSVLDDQGRILPATIADAPRAENGPVEDCGYLVQQLAARIPVVPVVAGPWWARVDYLASEDGWVTLRTGRLTRRIAVQKGLHQLIFRTDGDFSSVWMSASDGVTLCVDNIHVGDVVPVLPVGETPPREDR